MDKGPSFVMAMKKSGMIKDAILSFSLGYKDVVTAGKI
jgi:hypothetical protein